MKFLILILLLASCSSAPKAVDFTVQKQLLQVQHELNRAKERVSTLEELNSKNSAIIAEISSLQVEMNSALDRVPTTLRELRELTNQFVLYVQKMEAILKKERE